MAAQESHPLLSIPHRALSSSSQQRLLSVSLSLPLSRLAAGQAGQARLPLTPFQHGQPAVYRTCYCPQYLPARDCHHPTCLPSPQPAALPFHETTFLPFACHSPSSLSLLLLAPQVECPLHLRGYLEVFLSQTENRASGSNRKWHACSSHLAGAVEAGRGQGAGAGGSEKEERRGVNALSSSSVRGEKEENSLSQRTHHSIEGRREQELRRGRLNPLHSLPAAL